MIAWFEKHLDAAIVFYTAFAWLFAILLVVFCLYIANMSYLPFPGEPYEIFSPYEIVDFLPTFQIQAIVDVAILVSLPVYFLILKKKKSSLWFLLFFLPPLYPVHYPVMVVVFLMPFWWAGWIILLCLKSRQSVTGKKHITYVL
jgi:hypothetical protein